MADGDSIRIVYTGDPSQAIRAGKQVTDNLSEVDDSLDDLARTSGTATKDVEGDLDTVGKASDDAGGKLGDLGSAARDALEGDIGGAAQGAAEAISTLGPAAAVAGAVGAAGITLVTAALTAQQEEAKKTHDELVGMYRDAAEEGRIYLNEAQIISAANDVLFDSEKRKEAAEEARRVGIDLITYVRAQAGDQEALNLVIERSTALYAEAGKVGEDKSKAGQAAALAEKDAIGDVVRENEKLRDIHIEGQEAAALAKQLVAEQQGAAEAAINRTADTAQKRYEGLAQQAATPIKLTIDTTEADKSVENFLRLKSTRKVLITADVVDRYGKPVR